MIKTIPSYPPLPERKRIALVAHDNAKREMLEWVERHKLALLEHVLVGTGTTGSLIEEQTGLSVRCFKSGPLGGDQQIGAQIAEFQIDCLIFFWDPLTSQPHDPDVKALLRLAVLYNIPTATNSSSADFLMASTLMNATYARAVPGFLRMP